MRIDVAAFRRDGVRFATLLRAVPATVVFAEDVEQLLRLHLEEIRARQAAEDGRLKISDAPRTRERVEASGRFRRPLTDEQTENVARLLSLRHGANFSVPGAGKTTSLLAVYEALRGEGFVDRLLVVAPKNAFISWEEEVGECFIEADRPRIARLTGGSAGVRLGLDTQPEIALITYQLLVNVADQIRTWSVRHDTHIALDESHRIKSGHSAITASAALELADSAVRRDILSGTPLPHSAEDLRPQFDFLWPGQRILPTDRVRVEASASALTEVEQAVSSLYVRTTKSQLGLPDLVPQRVPVPLGPLQQELYDVLRSEAARLTAGMSMSDVRLFRMLGAQVVRLLQAAVNPMLLTQGELVSSTQLEPVPEGSRAWELLRELARYEQPAKITKALERAEAFIADGEKVLIWTQFVMNVESLERLLEHHGAVVLYGQVPTGDDDDLGTREGRIRAFHEDPGTKVMIANPAAAGEGISLHRACQRAIYLDRNFNAAHYLQSLDRIHRLGLPEGKVPQVEILEATGTIDRRVDDRLARKIQTMSAILNDPGLGALAYDPGDIDEEFGGGIEPADVEEVLDHLTHDDQES